MDRCRIGAGRAGKCMACDHRQTFTFAVARLVARQQVIAGWGLGVLLRFASVAFWALLGIKALGLVAGPALLSLVVFYFLSTLVEPLFLN